jgi:dihydrofolate synthase/folylpolyglutamate synthase
VISGIKKAKLSGRFEVVSQSVPIIFDVAHNPQAVNFLASQLAQQQATGKTLAVVGMLADKDIETCLWSLIPCIDGWYAADLDVETPRGAKSSRLTNYLATKTEKNCYNFASVAAALATAMADSKPADRIVVFGSFYTVALAKQYLVCEKDIKNGEK